MRTSITSDLNSLPCELRALIALAVLLDGFDASSILGCDLLYGERLSRLADNMVALPLNLRMPLAGTLLRSSLAELGGVDDGGAGDNEEG